MKTVNPRWARIQELFNQAADLPLAQRSGFLDKECGNDAALRKELEELLATDAGPPSGPDSGIRASVLTHAISLSLDKVQQDRRAELVGTKVGAYRLTSILGHGGAGTVYLGERSDRQYSARVAVKVLEQTLHETIAYRFRAERQILANLSHPYIAKLFDAGETTQGQPYLVMEYVHGEPIDRYCDNQKLTIKQRLQLFLKVCTAVQYAHQNLIVHRDLKPGNILVTPDGTPKLLDFGIAKLLDTQSSKPKADMHDQPLTRMNDRVLTPEYASPEQILGQNITTTSDVYALGIVLYELLTGTRPYQVNVLSQLELERIICIMDPPWPTQMLAQVRAGKHANLNLATLADARNTSVRRLQHELEGDLDAIVMRALRKETDQRYNSIEQLVDDLERYLNNAPVQARQGNWLYYSRRFISRHWVGVSTSAFIIVTLATVAVILSVQNRRITEQRDLVQQENQRAETVSNFMLDVFSSSDPFESQGKEVTAKELLDKAGERINGDLNQQPAVRARLMAAIGRAYQRQMQPELALKYLQDALQLLRSQKNTPTDTLVKTLDSLANAQRDAGNYAPAMNSLTEGMQLLEKNKQTHNATYLKLLSDLAKTDRLMGDIHGSEQNFLQALELARSLYGNTHPETALVLASLGQIKQAQGDLNAATPLFREATAIYHATLSENHPDRIMVDLAMARLLTAQGHVDEAYAIAVEALKKQRLLYGDNNIRLTTALDLLATLSQRKLNWDAAEQYSREALRISLAALGSNNALTADLYTGLADLLLRRQRYAEAEKELRNALSFLQTVNNPSPIYMASAEYMLADVLAHTHRESAAIELLNANLSRLRSFNAPTWGIARSQNLLSWLLWNTKHDPKAKQLLLDSYETLKAPNSGASTVVIDDARKRTESVIRPSAQSEHIAEPRDLARQETQRAEALSNFMLDVFNSSDPFVSQGKQVTAKELLDKAGAQINDNLNQQPVARAQLMAAIGRAYQRQSQPTLAIKYLQDALKLFRTQPNTPAETLAKTLDSLGNAHRDAGIYMPAMNELKEGLQLLESKKQTHTPLYLQLLGDIAKLETRMGNIQSSEQHFIQALNLARSLYGNTHPETALALAALGQIKHAQGDLNGATPLLREATNIYHATLPENHPDRIITDLMLAYLLTTQGHFDEAQGLAIEALKRQRQIYGNDNIKLTYTLDILSTLSQRKLNWEAADQYSREALRICMTSLGAHNVMTADLQTGLADLLIRRQRYDEAKSELRKALDFLTTDNSNPVYLTTAQYMLADVYAHTHREAAAIDLLNANLKRLQGIDTASWRTARSQNLLGWVMWNTQHDPNARRLLMDSYAALKAPNSGASTVVIDDARKRTESVIPSLQTHANEQQAAMEPKRRVEAPPNFMLNVFNASNPLESQSQQVTARQLLDKAAEQIKDNLKEQPVARAQLLAAIGRAYQRQSQPMLAIKYLQDALQLFRTQPDTSIETLAKTLDSLGSAHRDAGMYMPAMNELKEGMQLLESKKQTLTAIYLQLLGDLAKVEIRMGNVRGSEQHFLQTLDLARRLYGKAHPEIATALSALGQIKQVEGDLNAATPLLREATAINRASLPENHPDRVMTDLLLAQLLTAQGDFDEAYALSTEGLKKQRLLYGNDNIKLCYTLDLLSTVEQRQLKWDAAEQHSREALRISITALGSNNIKTADLQTALADLLIRRKHYGEAETELHKSLTFLRSANNLNPLFVASAEYMLADVFAHTHRTQAATDLLSTNLKHLESIHAPSWMIARSQNLLGWVVWNTQHDPKNRQLLLDSYNTLKAPNSGASTIVIDDARKRTESVIPSLQTHTNAPHSPVQPESSYFEAPPNSMLNIFNASNPLESQSQQITARQLLDKAAEQIKDNLKEQPVARAQLLAAIGRAYQRQSQPMLAIKYLQDALQLFRTQAGTPTNTLVKVLDSLGNAQRDFGHYTLALNALSEGMQLLKKNQQTRTAVYLQVLSDVAKAESAMGNLRDSESHFLQTLELARSLYGNAHPETAGALASLGQIKHAQGNLNEAIPLLREAVAIKHATLSENHPDRITVDLMMARLLLNQGHVDEAQNITLEALKRQRLVYGDDNIKLTLTLDLLSSVSQSKLNWDAAERYSREALRINMVALGSHNAKTADLQTGLADLLIRRQRYDEAEMELHKALNSLQATNNSTPLFTASAEYMLADVLAHTHREPAAVDLLNTNIKHLQGSRSPSWMIARSQNLLGWVTWNIHHDPTARQLLLDSYATLKASNTGAPNAIIDDARKRSEPVLASNTPTMAQAL